MVYTGVDIMKALKTETSQLSFLTNLLSKSNLMMADCLRGGRWLQGPAVLWYQILETCGQSVSQTVSVSSGARLGGVVGSLDIGKYLEL